MQEILNNNKPNMPLLHDCATAARKIMEHRENHDPLSPTTIYNRQKSDESSMFFTNEQKCHQLHSLFWKYYNTQDKFAKLNQQISAVKSDLEASQNQLTIHQWIYEETLVQYYLTLGQAIDQKLLQDFFQNKPRRTQVLTVLKRWMDQNFSEKIEELLKKCDGYEEQITRLLQWQANNRELQSMLPIETKNSRHLKDLIQREKSEKLDVLVNQIKSIVNYENHKDVNCSTGQVLDSTAYSIIFDCINLVKKIEILKFDEIDMSLGEFLTASSEQSRNVPQFMDFMANELRNAQKLTIEKERLFHQNKQVVKSLVGKQGQLFDKVRSQLKKLHQTNADFDNNKMEEYFRSISKEMVDFGESDGDSEQECIEKWSLELDNLYNQLEGLANPDDKSVDEKSQQLLEKNMKLQQYDGLQQFSGSSPYSSPKIGNNSSSLSGSKTGAKSSSTNNTTTGGLNAQALKVWSKVQRKLHDLDGMNSVDLLIKEATDKTNLSKLYEGWTSWV